MGGIVLRLKGTWRIQVAATEKIGQTRLRKSCHPRGTNEWSGVAKPRPALFNQKASNSSSHLSSANPESSLELKASEKKEYQHISAATGHTSHRFPVQKLGGEVIDRKIPTVTVRRIYNVIAGKWCRKALRALSNGSREQADREHTILRQSENFPGSPRFPPQPVRISVSHHTQRERFTVCENPPSWTLLRAPLLCPPRTKCLPGVYSRARLSEEKGEGNCSDI